MDEMQLSSPHSSTEDTLPSSAEYQHPDGKSGETNPVAEHCCCQQPDSPGVPLTNLSAAPRTVDEQAEPSLPIAILPDPQPDATESDEPQGAETLQTPATPSAPSEKDASASSVLKSIPPVDLVGNTRKCVECTNPSCPHYKSLLPASSIPQTPTFPSPSSHPGGLPQGQQIPASSLNVSGLPQVMIAIPTTGADGNAVFQLYPSYIMPFPLSSGTTMQPSFMPIQPSPVPSAPVQSASFVPQRSEHNLEATTSDASESSIPNIYKPSVKEEKCECKDDECKIRCSCSRTHCLKLYCECLKAGRECGPHCTCSDCYNHADRVERQKALMFLKRRSSTTMRSAQVGKQKICGCNCQKSQCCKKYCSCYLSGKPCCPECNCVNCANK